ncbi:MAG: lamin tail domain-containing protein, partial [Planctomycetes bacterium]|nr:lamin tail domain-containing protein [Planctomycetota bacterium]
EFERMWELGRERYQPFLARLSAGRGNEDYRRWIPIHFSPMTLDRKETGRIRYQAQKCGLFRDPGAVGHWWWDRERRVASDEFPVIPFLEFGRVLISEVLHAPADAARGEFIEIYNGAELPVDLADWRLDDGDGVDRIRPWKEGGPTVLAPGAFALILDPDADPKGFPDATVLMTVKDGRAIGNGLGAGDLLRLLRPDGSLADETPPLAETATGGCLARPTITAEDLVAHEAGKASPGAPNPGW